MILNLGAGKKLIKNAINVDVTAYPGIQQVVDLSVFPWPWKDQSIDGIHASHIIEHFFDQKKFIEECYRILKSGGFLRIVAPHSSCITSVGCLGHYRTYSYSTFNDYLAKDFYMFKTKRFETTYQRLNWWHEAIDEEGNLNVGGKVVIKILNPIMNFIINLSPRIYENVFAGVVQCREIIWEGVKI
jgi:ubiquinone/menaquinone biosynthesis C-methylase UbiE